MRRGHPGRGGWRGDSPRHFRPRTGGSPGFRPPRPFQASLLEMPRFPIQNQPRFPFRGRPQQEQYHDRKYHVSNRQMEQRNTNKSPGRPSPWQADHRPPVEQFPPDHHDRYNRNNMGDVDERQQLHKPFEDQPGRWIDQNCQRHFGRYDESHDSQINKLPIQDVAHSGHRPPASDHYEGRGPGIDNSNTFSRSVDDTVSIIRRKLQNRNDPQSRPSSRQEESESMREPVDTYQQSNMQQDNAPRRKSHRPRQNMKSNCDQIKNKIVHQLFKMDKDRIHKLVDNPNSSTKFDYAINSLISESQNSFNRHLRETAEKSLGCSRNDIVSYNEENDTIYEDTFMKQMQCILDPQDTILLEDIKPIVMAELNKVLQLNDFDQRQLVSSEEVDMHPNDQHEYDPRAEYAGDPQSDPQYYEAHSSYSVHQYEGTYRRPERPEKRPAEVTIKTEFDRETNKTFTSPTYLYERRSARKSCDYSSARLASSEHRRASVHKDHSFEEPSPSTKPPMPYFDVNTERLSDDDDPFAELDKQYHVAVDHNFIETDDMIPETSHAIKTPPPQKEVRESKPPPRRDSLKSDRHRRHLQQEIRHDSPDMPLEVLEVERNNILSALDNHIKKELLSTDYTKESADSAAPQKERVLETTIVKIERLSENKEQGDVLDKSDSSNMSSDKSLMNLNPRKRSTDQRPSHRKEKRKKSESSQSDNNKQILNKNIIINLNDCVANTTEKRDSNAKSVFNLYFSKGDNTSANDGKKAEGSISNYSDKYVKRKESPLKTIKSKKPEKKDRSVLTSPNHSTPMSTNKETNTSADQGTSKSDNKIKLKPIDMFTEQPKKVAPVIHQAHRNTATPAKTPTEEKKIPIIKIKPLKSISKQITRKHVSTQIVRKVFSKLIQTETSKTVTKCIQTDPVSFEKGKKNSTDAFERMKEIDLEIQVLLQEKFKLYNSLEAREATGSMQNLGITVVDVPLEEKESLSADNIVEEFTSIPEDELTEIALESVDHDDPDFDPKYLKATTHNRSKQIAESLVEHSPDRPARSGRDNKKARSPNISILEKIITDDVPLEDIISLDDLESSPVKPQRVRFRNPIRKTYKAKKPPQRPKVTTSTQQPRRQIIKPVAQPNYDIKPCCVLLSRTDIDKYLNRVHEKTLVIDITQEEELQHPEKAMIFTEEVIEEQVNDFHFQVDMLDVCEDIVLGSEDKIDDRESESVPVPATEEIVLDNSQLADGVDVLSTESHSGECKMFDFSADEDLKHDSVTVSGNADAVLAIEFVEQNFLAACLDGNVYHFSGSGQLLSTLRGSNLAVTCLTIVREKYGTTVYTGSLDSRIRYYDLEDGLEKGPECNVLSPIQTMDRAWDTVFVGTRTGFVLQFECKNNMLIPVSTIKFSDQSILALRALKEGPRKVLLVAARSENVTIKDAQTGLLLRTLVGPKMTVYTLLYEDGKVFCGTSSNQVQVFDYASGSHMGEHDGGKGAVCLRAAGGLLFAGCYDGCVYIFRSGGRRPFAQLRGPGVMLLSLTVVGSKMIVGYKDRSLYIWKIPEYILQEMVL